MAIKPLSIPSAAGLSRGEGDVRHFSEGDALNVIGVSGPTRNLAERDNLIAEKLNETIAQVNNKEQFVPLPVLSTTLPPNDSINVTNFRIPAGFEARVLNATVASAPISSDIELNVYYSEGFGSATGEVLVTTSDEVSGGTSFKQAGELIVSIRNKGGITLDVVASVLLTMRPVGEEGTLLVGSVVRGDKGEPGQTGPRGIQGIPGTGGAGTPGMVWTGAWVEGRAYNTKDVASFDLYGTLTSSYICMSAHTADTSNEPPNQPYWDAVAVGSSGTNVGSPGPEGPAVVPTYGAAAIIGTIVPDGGFVGGTTENGYTGGGAAYGTTTVQWNECYIDSGSHASPIKGVALINATFRRVYNGNVKIYLPQVTPEGAKVNWNTTGVLCQASINGSYGLGSGAVDTVQVTSPIPSQYNVHVKAATPQKVSVSFVGFQSIT